MKKFFVVLCVFLLACCVFTGTATMVASAQSTSAKSAVVMEKNSCRVLYEKNSHHKLPMASTTKIVTALTVLQNSATDKVVEIPKEACGIEGSSVYLTAGEHFTVEQLLYGLMLRSGNDCAVALALTVGGSVEGFAEMMNDTAASLGCCESNFKNPHGLPNDNHYTSAYDLAVITCAALKNKEFQKIVSTKSVRICNDGKERVWTNKNKLLSSYDGADGVKTGYTKKAGRCFVGSATKNGMQVVVVVLNCGPMFEDTAKLLDYAFANYSLRVAVPENKLCGVVYERGKPTYYYCSEGFSYPLKEGEHLKCNVVLQEDKQQIEVYLGDSCVFRRNLTAQTQFGR